MSYPWHPAVVATWLLVCIQFGNMNDTLTAEQGNFDAFEYRFDLAPI